MTHIIFAARNFIHLLWLINMVLLSEEYKVNVNMRMDN